MYILSPWDYLIISTWLLFSSGIGIYFAYQSRRRQTSLEYFVGNRDMSILPIAISITATYISALTYLGIPAEVYIHGPKYGLMVVLRIFVPFVVMYCFIPVFYRLEITTVYEYLNMRFNNTVRFLAITEEFVGGFIYMGIVVYTPALALSTVTGMDLTFSIITIGSVCTFYTTVGGIKAVIWTDVFQALSMILGATVMVIAGLIKIGGPVEGWRRATEGHRTEFVDFNIDPTVRLTFWTIGIGGFPFLTYTIGTSQTFAQRYLACKSERDSQIACWLGSIGTGAMEVLAITTGMTVFAYYYTCDPLTTKEIERPDQIVPYFIMDVFHSVPGVPGLLIAGALCASLSSMSSVLNAIVTMTGQDIIKTIWPNISNRRYLITVKILSALFGGISIALAFLVSILGDILQTGLSIAGLTGGPVLGLFIIALFIPRGNSAGAISGLIAGFAVGLFFYIGSQIYPPDGNPPPLSTEGCTASFVNETTTITDGEMLTEMFSSDYTTASPFKEYDAPSIFHLSYLYLSLVSSLATLFVGVVVSYVTSRNNPQLAQSKLLAPIIARRMGNAPVGNDNGKSEHFEKEQKV